MFSSPPWGSMWSLDLWFRREILDHNFVLGHFRVGWLNKVLQQYDKSPGYLTRECNLQFMSLGCQIFGKSIFWIFWHVFHRCQTLWFISKPITNTKIISMIQSKSINSSYPSEILMVSGCCKDDYPFDIIWIVPSQSKSLHPTKISVQLMIPVSTPELWARHSRHSWHQCVETSADTPSIGCPTDGEGVPSNGTVVWGGSLLRRLFLGDITLK